MGNCKQTKNKEIVDLSCVDILDSYINRTGVESKIWIELENGNYLFKIDDSFQQGFYEMIVSNVCNAIGVDCVEVKPAVFNCERMTENKATSSFYSFMLPWNRKMAGVLVKSYLNGNSACLNLDALDKKFNKNKYERMRFAYSVKEAKLLIEQLKQSGYDVDSSIVEKLKAMCLCDYLLCQEDRHRGNIEFLFYNYNNGKCHVKLAPMFDNGRCLGFDCNVWIEIVKLCRRNNARFVMEIEDYDFLSGKCKKVNEGKALAREILIDENLRKTFVKLSSINFEQIVKSVAKSYPSTVSEKRQKLAIMAFKMRVAKLERYLKVESLKTDKKLNRLVNKLLDKKTVKNCDGKELI